MDEIQISRSHLLAPFVIMMKNGVPCRTLIDVGSADGTFSLEFLTATGGGGTIFNIDANAEYSSSLARIQSEIGGGYRICALSSYDGNTMLAQGRHEYWRTLGGAAGDGDSIECRTLDSVCTEHGLSGPFFIKMDVESAELAALLGAEKGLEQTAGILLETNIYYGRHTGGKFIDVCNFLAARGFSLFDIVGFGYRNHDAVLYQTYCAYLHQRYEFRDRASNVEGEEAMAHLTDAMRQRRASLRERNEKLLADLKTTLKR